MVTPIHTEQKPFCCAKCRGVLGAVLPSGALHFGGFQIVSPVQIRCMGCGWVTKWRPGETAEAVDRTAARG